MRLRLLSSSRDQVERVCEHLCQSLGLALAWEPSVRGDQVYSGGVHLGPGGVVLELMELPHLASAARQWAKKSPISRLVSVDLTEREGAVKTPSSLLDLAKWVTEDRPVVVPSLELGEARAPPTDPGRRTSEVNEPKGGALGIRGLREVVLSYGEDAVMSSHLSEAMEQLGRPMAGIPDVWRVPCRSDGEIVAFRLLPSSLSAIVVGVDSIAAAKEELARRRIPCESIGLTGASQGQLLLSSPILNGLDIRLCHNDEAPSIFFNEGNEVMMQDVLEELNPALVRAAATATATTPSASSSADAASSSSSKRVEYRNLPTDGHCWSEFHANVKRPAGWLKKRPPGPRNSS